MNAQMSLHRDFASSFAEGWKFVSTGTGDAVPWEEGKGEKEGVNWGSRWKHVQLRLPTSALMANWPPDRKPEIMQKGSYLFRKKQAIDTSLYVLSLAWYIPGT